MWKWLVQEVPQELADYEFSEKGRAISTGGGILIGVVLSIPIWGLIIWAVFW